MSENLASLHPYPLEVSKGSWRRACGCIKTSEKLKQILLSFPAPPPPTPAPAPIVKYQPFAQAPVIHCISSSCKNDHFGKVHVHNTSAIQDKPPEDLGRAIETMKPEKLPVMIHRLYRVLTKICTTSCRPKRLLVTLATLIQLAVMATALALYYLIYCYMQLVYYTLKTALYFHQADGPMKVTIGVMTMTTVVVGFNLLLKMEKLVGFGDK